MSEWELTHGDLPATWNSEGDLFPDSVGEPQRMHILGLAQTRLHEFPQESLLLAEVWRKPAHRVTGPAERIREERLVEVLRRADDSLGRLDGYRAYWGENDDAFVSLADKITVETALLALVARRHAGERPRVRLLVDRLARSLDPLVRSMRNEALLRRYPNGALSLAVGHAAVTALGIPDPEFDRLVKSALECDLLDCSERLNFRAMERRWMVGLLYPGTDPSFDDLLPMSIATRQAHPIHMLATDVYALTHVPMFVTDFGSSAAPEVFPHASFRGSLDATAAWVVHAENFDLMGEVVLARELLGEPWTASHVLAWKTLEHAWDHLGFLASPSFSIKLLNGLPAEERCAYAFLHTYHTTYVAGMLSSVMLGAASSPPRQVVAPRGIGAAEASALREECRAAFTAALEFALGGPVPAVDVDRLAATACRDRGESALSAVRRLMALWSERGHRAPDALADVLDSTGLPDVPLASSLADGLLTCAARTYDLVVLAELLRVVAVNALPLTPTVAAAARFLARQQLPGGAIGGWFLDPRKRSSASAAEVTTGLASALGALSTHPRLRERS